MILASIPNGVLPNGAIITYGRCELCGVLGDVGAYGWVGYDYGLLEVLEVIGFSVGTPCT